MKFLFTLLIIFTFIFPSIAVSQGQSQERQPSQCGEREMVMKALEEQYNEKPVAMGLTSTGLMMELFSSPDGSTWTIGLTQPNKTLCLMVGGSHLINLIGKENKSQDINTLSTE